MFQTTVAHTSKFPLKFCVEEPVYNGILAGIRGGKDDGDRELGRGYLFKVHCQETDDKKR